MSNKSVKRFVVGNDLYVEIEDAGDRDPTGIICLVLEDNDGTKLASIPMSPEDIPELVKQLSKAAITLENKGGTLCGYEAGYNAASAGRPPEHKIIWPKLR